MASIYVHLLVADDHVMYRSGWAGGACTAVCGEPVTEPSAVAGDDTRYCPACAAEAVRWSGEEATGAA